MRRSLLERYVGNGQTSLPTQDSVLIIDDNVKSLELLSTALAQPGLEILTASDPEQGIDLVFEKHPQIVLTDLVMPNLGGPAWTILERIMEFDPSTEVIIMTAHYSTESAVEAIKKGASDYLNKPISIAALRERDPASLWKRPRRRRQRTLAAFGSRRIAGQLENSKVSWVAQSGDAGNGSASPQGRPALSLRPYYGRDGHGERPCGAGAA